MGNPLTRGGLGRDNVSSFPGLPTRGPGRDECSELKNGIARRASGRGRDRPAISSKGRLVNWEDVIVEASATDTGMRRANNQDSHAIVRAATRESWKLRGHLFMVADGMGAHAAGELASKMACDNIPHNYFKSKTGTPTECLIKAYREVGGQIHAKATANKDFLGM